MSTNPATDPGVLDAIGQAERIGDRAVANLLRREAAAASASWATVTPAAFDADAPDVQQALFAAPDPCGTLDLFADLA